MTETEDQTKDESKAKGGRARAEKLAPERRKEIASTAASARWRGAPVKATHAGVIRIGDASLDCANLVDGRRVISEAAIMRALERGYSGYYSQRDAAEEKGGSAVLPRYVAPKAIQPFIPNDLLALLSEPIAYMPPGGSAMAKGVEAQALPKICRVWIEARNAQKLKGDAQRKTAAKAEMLSFGFAEVGIAALVDEATGFQRERATDALAKILEAFIAKELQPYVPTFKQEYYAQLFRLRGLEYPKDTVQRPQYFGVLTNDIVYKRLAPGVLAELKKVIPRNEAGRPTAKYFQRLTSNKGYPKLMEHLGAVMAVMRLSSDYHDFIGKLDMLYPRYGQQMLLPYEPDTDTGKGI
jgi:hypothetical protein